MFWVIYATSPRGVCTRFIIGCPDVADRLILDLVGVEYTVVTNRVPSPPARCAEEAKRAQQILATLHPRLGVPQ